MEFKLIDWLKSLNILQQLFLPPVYQTWWIRAPHIYEDGISSEDNLSKLSRGEGGGEETRPQNVLKKTKTVLANWQNLHNWKLSCQYKRFKECDSRWFPKLPFDKELEQISTCWVVLERSTGNRCSKVPPLEKFLDKYLFNNWLYLSRY